MMGLDAGLRRHDGVPEALRCAYHPLTCIFEAGHEGHEGSEIEHSELRITKVDNLSGLRKFSYPKLSRIRIFLGPRTPRAQSDGPRPVIPMGCER